MKLIIHIYILFSFGVGALAIATCKLCDDYMSNSTSCRNLSNYVSKLDSNDTLCSTIKTRFDQCCHQPTIPQREFPYVGPFNICDICLGKYPGDQSMVMTFLYLGSGSCIQYYRFGKEGRIPNHLCSVVQYLSTKVCNCI